MALVSLVVTIVLAEPFSHLHHHHTSSASASGSGSESSSSGSASGSGYHYPKPKKAFYLPAASHTKIKIIKHHGVKKHKKVKYHAPITSYGTPSSSASGSGSGSSSSGSGSGTSATGHAHHHKPTIKVIIKKHSKGHAIHRSHH